MRRAESRRLGLIVIAAILFSSIAPAQEPRTLLFEGEYASGRYGTLSDDVFSMQFSIYDSPQGGNKLWPMEEGFEIHPSVTVKQGRFSVVLGSRRASIMPDVPFGQTVYVQIGVCLPAGPDCRSFEPLPMRLPLKTPAMSEAKTTRIGTPEPQSRPVLLESRPTIKEPEAKAIETLKTARIANDHNHLGETWSGPGTGLTLRSEGLGLLGIASSAGDDIAGLKGLASSGSGQTVGVHGQTQSDNPQSAGVRGAATRGVGVLGQADKAYDSSIGGRFSGWTGILGEGFGANAPGLKGMSQVNTGVGVWGESAGGAGYAGYFAAPKGTGLYIGEAGNIGLSILKAGNNGIVIHDTGAASSHVYPQNFELGTTSDAIRVGGARDFGLWVGFSGRAGAGIGRTSGHGFWVLQADADGFRLESSKKNGLSIGRAELTGIHIAHAGASGLVVDNAGLHGVHVRSQVSGVVAESVRGAGGVFKSQESHALIADGPALVGGRTPEQIGMLKWYEAREMPDVIPTKSNPIGLAFDGQHIWVGHGSGRETLQLLASDGHEVEKLEGPIARPAICYDGLRLWFVETYTQAFGIRGYKTGEWKQKSIGASIFATVSQSAKPTSAALDGRHVWVGADTGVYRFTPTEEPFDHLPPFIDSLLGLPLKGVHHTPWGTIGNCFFKMDKYAVTCSALAYDGKYIWIANSGTNRVLKMHANNMQVVGSFDVGKEPIALAFDGANIWVANSSEATVTKVRASDGNILGTYPVGAKPKALVFDGFHIWVANEADNTLSKLRVVDGAAVGTFKTGRSPRALVFDGRHVWVANYLDDTLMKF